MEEDEDDFYGGGAAGAPDEDFTIKPEEDAREEKMDVSEEQNEDEEEDSDDVGITCGILASTCINQHYVGCSIHSREARRRKDRVHVRRLPSIFVAVPSLTF